MKFTSQNHIKSEYFLILNADTQQDGLPGNSMPLPNDSPCNFHALAFKNYFNLQLVLL